MYRNTEQIHIRPETVDIELRRHHKRPTSGQRKRKFSTSKESRNLGGRRSPKLNEFQDRNLELKDKVSQLKQENKKLKTRGLWLESELMKKEEGERPSQLKLLNNSLKKQLAAAKLALTEKDKTIAKLRKDIKFTNLEEIEKQSKVYETECKRLKGLLDEALKQMNFAMDSEEMQQKYLEQCSQIRKLRKNYAQVTKLNDQLNEEIKFWKEKATIVLKRGKKGGANYVLEMKNKIESLTKEKNQTLNLNQQLTKELQELRGSILQGDDRCYGEMTGEQSQLLTPLINKVTALGIKKCWELIAGPQDRVEKESAKAAFDALQVEMTEERAELVFDLIAFSGPFFDFNSFKDCYFSQVAMLPCYRHISLSLQVKRYAYNELPSIIFTNMIGQRLSRQQFLDQLVNFPVELKQPIAEQIVEDVFGTNDVLDSESILGVLEERLQTWKVLSEEEEADYDCQLSNLFSPIKEDVLQSCQGLDIEGSGYLAAARFYHSCDEIGASVGYRLRKYLELLFYTDREELDIVPYKNFIQVYT